MKADFMRKLCFAVRFIFMVLWLSNLARTDGYFSVYALCGFASMMCMTDNYRCQTEARVRLSWLVLSGVFSLAVILANYPIFQYVRETWEVSAGTNLFLNMLEAGCTIVGGVFTALNVISWMMYRYPQAVQERKWDPFRNSPAKVFVLSFLCILTVYYLYLFMTVYPGNLTPDSIDQVTQTYTGKYVNDHPFWHTVSIKIVLELGYALFQNSNAAAATYSALQGVFMAAVFSYGLMTLYQSGMSLIWIGIAFCMYAFMPHNITYSATMWKDVPFGCTLLLMVIALFRCMRNVDAGKTRKLDYVLLILGGFLFCIMRTNGWYTLLVAALILIPNLWKNHRSIALSLIAVLAAGWIMIGPMITALDVRKTDFVETLSLPLQQIARVITDGGNLMEDETEMLERILDLEEVPELYNAGLSDPIKIEVREHDTTYLKGKLADYGRLWFRVGLRYPGKYLEAWIDQTKGYWNGGYDKHIYAHYIHPNDYGIYIVEQSNNVCKLMKAYLTLVRETVVFQPLQSIGLHVWIMALLCFLNVQKKRKVWLLTVPSLIVVLGLCIGTPVYAEFRYAYPVFTVFPFVVPLLLYQPMKKG